jgi:hypothetical protein
MSHIRILDPTAAPPALDADPGPALASDALGASRFGIRYDLTWRSFAWVRDEWAAALRGDGAQVETFCAGDRAGEAGQQTERELASFVQAQDVAIVGLGN